MRARVGDTLVVSGSHARTGLIVRVVGQNGAPPYVIKWLADGDEVMDVIEEMTEPMGMTSSLRLTGQLDDGVPGDIGEDMLHALREALSNAARHGKATSAEVKIGAGSELSLLVRDNGSGITDTSRRSGLANLAQRAEHYGGTLKVGPAEGGGTELHWRVPLPGHASPETGR
jgi:signal transduction histidine kinase